MPAGTRMLLQSNNYFAEPTHIACVDRPRRFWRAGKAVAYRLRRRTADEEVYALYADRAGLGGTDFQAKFRGLREGKISQRVRAVVP